MTERFVLDCSVAVKWYLQDEEDVDLAQLIQLGLIEDTLELHAPELLKYEVAHALSKACRVRRPRLSQRETQKAFDHFCNLPIQFYPAEIDFLKEALLFSNRFHRNFYDSCYLRLAEHLDCSWLTAESKFQGPFPLGFPEGRIQILSSLRISGSP